MLQIHRLTAGTGRAALPVLAALLIDTVESGASIGFLPPVSLAEAEEYWLEVLEQISTARFCWRHSTMAR